MKRHTLSILFGLAAPFLLLSSCKQDGPLIAPDPDPVTPAITEEGKITLDKPIVLSVAVAPMRVVDPYADRFRALGDQVVQPTVNTPDNSVNTDDMTNEELAKWYSTYDGGDDWIRSINIPELKLGEDYTVEGLVPWEKTGERYKPAVPPEGGVTVTLKKLPASRQISLFANAEVRDLPDLNTGDNSIKYADLSNPLVLPYNYLVIEDGILKEIRLPYIVSSGIAKKLDDENIFKKYQSEKLTIMESRNLPMYGSVKDLTIKSGKLVGKQMDQTTAQEFQTIYLERAVAKVEVYIENLMEVYKSDVPETLQWYDQIRPSRYVNCISLLPDDPNNKNRIGSLWSRWYSHDDYPYWWNDAGNSPLGINKSVMPNTPALERGGLQNSFFFPEHMGNGSLSSTISVAISQFQYDKNATEGSRLSSGQNGRHTKIFKLSFGKLIPGASYKVQRNTIYRLYLRKKLKGASTRSVPYKSLPEGVYELDF